MSLSSGGRPTLLNQFTKQIQQINKQLHGRKKTPTQHTTHKQTQMQVIYDIMSQLFE